MSHDSNRSRNKAFVIAGLGVALVIAALVSPFASSAPDGLNRVAEDLGFADAEHPEAPARQLPFAQVFDGYAFRGAPEGIATPIAGLVGTLVTFAIAWGVGKLVVRNTSSQPPSDSDSSDRPLT